MDLDLDRLKGAAPRRKNRNGDRLRFEVGPNSFFTVLVFNDVLRGRRAGLDGFDLGKLQRSFPNR